MSDQNPQDVDPGNQVVESAINPEADCPIQTSVQPFQKCAKRDEWDSKYQHEWRMDLEKEKQILREKKKAPRKPLSPYIFFSQEKRKEIKKSQEGANLTAKQIMKMVSKRWQEIKEDKNATERYEYMSIRDREAYSDLRVYWDKVRAEMSLVDPKNEGGSGEETSTKRSNRGVNRFNRNLAAADHGRNQNKGSHRAQQSSPKNSQSENQISIGNEQVDEQKILPKKRGRKKNSDSSAHDKTSAKPKKRTKKFNIDDGLRIQQKKDFQQLTFTPADARPTQFPSTKERSASMDNHACYQNNLRSSAPFQSQRIATHQINQKLAHHQIFEPKLSEIKELKSENNTDLEDHNPTKNTIGSQLQNKKPASIDQNLFKGFDYDKDQANTAANRTTQQQQGLFNKNCFEQEFEMAQDAVISDNPENNQNIMQGPILNREVSKPQDALAINTQYSFEADQNPALLTPLRKQDSNTQGASDPREEVQPETILMQQFQSSLYKTNSFENERLKIVQNRHEGADQQSPALGNNAQMSFAQAPQQQDLPKIDRYENENTAILDLQKWLQLQQNQSNSMNENNQSSQ